MGKHSIGPHLCRIVAALSVVLAGSGCGREEEQRTAPRDPNSLEALVEGLSTATDDVQRRSAVARIEQLYVEAKAQDAADPSASKAKAVLDLAITPLVKVCADPNLPGATHSAIVQILAPTMDARSERSLASALARYQPGQSTADAVTVLRLAASGPMPGLAPAVRGVFLRIEASRDDAKVLAGEALRAMRALVRREDEDQLLKVLDRTPIETELTTENELYWEGVAILLLGEINSERAVRPLLRVMLTPSKSRLQPAALLALTRIGRPAIAPTVALLRGEDRDLGDAAERQHRSRRGALWRHSRGATHVRLSVASEVLCTIGTEEAVAPVLEALAHNRDELSRVVLAAPLARSPHGDATHRAFRTAYEQTDVSETVWARRAHETLAEQAPDFFDATFVPWMVHHTRPLVDEMGPGLVGPIRKAAFLALLTMMTPSQVAEVMTLKNAKAYPGGLLRAEAKTFKTTLADELRPELQQAIGLLDRCREGVACYLGEATTERNQVPATEFAVIKALYMVGIMGGEEQRDELIASLSKMRGLRVRRAALRAIEHLTQKDDNEMANELKALAEGECEAKPLAMLEADPLLLSAARLRGRAP